MKQLAKIMGIDKQENEVDLRFELLNRWTFLMMQVFECKTYIELAQKNNSVHTESSLNEVLTQQALFRSAILAYAKCFSDSGKNRTSLDKKRVFLGRPDLMEVHERLMHLRNKFAAHNDVSGLDEATIHVVEYDDEFIVRNLYAIANPLHEYTQYQQAFFVLEEFIVVQLNKAIDSLQKKLGKKINVRREE